MPKRMIDQVKEIEIATELANLLVNAIGDIVNNSGIAPANVYFMLWCGFTRALADAGWTADELVKDLRWHVEDQMKNEAGI